MQYTSLVQHILRTASVWALLVGSAMAEEFFLTPSTDVGSLIGKVTAGDTLVLENGTWTDAKLTFDQLAGSADAPVLIRAQTPGEVVFAGAAEFRVSGQHVVISGLVFRNTRGAGQVFQLRTHSQRHAHQCRVTDCAFEQTADFDAGAETKWMNIYGTRNRVDHCYFAGKQNRGPTLVVWVEETPGEHLIDRNHFGPRPELGENGGETIRIGTSNVSELPNRTVVEENYFHACDGEAEIISNKSCENIYRHNVFDACSGALTLRHGHRCRVDANVFLGQGKRGSGGVRIIGQGHWVTNNYFERLQGDAARAAISIMNGIPDGPLSGYAPVRAALVAHNTFIDCKVSMELGVGASERQSIAPAECRVAHNLFAVEQRPLFRIHAAPIDFVWDGNKRQSVHADDDELVKFERVEPDLARGADGLLRPQSAAGLSSDAASAVERDLDGYPREGPALAGCDDPRTPLRRWPAAATTGPEWKQ